MKNLVAQFRRHRDRVRARRQRGRLELALYEDLRAAATELPEPGERLACVSVVAAAAGIDRLRIVRTAMCFAGEGDMDIPGRPLLALALAITELAVYGRCSYPESPAGIRAAVIVQAVTAKEEA